MRVEDLKVYQKLCLLHLEVCDLTHEWPKEERYELGSQARRLSNSSAAQLAEKNNDRHVRNRIEGVNRSRGEALETVHHLYMGHLKRCFDERTFRDFQCRYEERVRMLNGLEQSLEQQLPPSERRWSANP